MQNVPSDQSNDHEDVRSGFFKGRPIAEISQNRGLVMYFFDVLLSRVPGDVVQSSYFLQAN